MLPPPGFTWEIKCSVFHFSVSELGSLKQMHSLLLKIFFVKIGLFFNKNLFKIHFLFACYMFFK